MHLCKPKHLLQFLQLVDCVHVGDPVQIHAAILLGDTVLLHTVILLGDTMQFHAVLLLGDTVQLHTVALLGDTMQLHALILLAVIVAESSDNIQQVETNCNVPGAAARLHRHSTEPTHHIARYASLVIDM